MSFKLQLTLLLLNCLLIDGLKLDSDCFVNDKQNHLVRLAHRCDSGLSWIHLNHRPQFNVTLHKSFYDLRNSASFKEHSFELYFKPDCVLKAKLLVDPRGSIVSIEQKSNRPAVLFGLPFQVEVHSNGLTIRSRSGLTMKQTCKVDFESTGHNKYRVLVGFWAESSFNNIDVIYFNATTSDSR
ncbi:hypothetical protein M3Y94_00052700 [Aphelenchoides besseyi]|nr:hypothetical protein M3Y94_00052700 [Aphelenchoides besseyi]KAI6217705.1 hypothetical protein M3Y95_01202500 [Aphelenchoides besseyi]